PEVAEQAQSHFAETVRATTLEEALTFARKQKEYFLLSPGPSQFLVMSRPGSLIRQFARLLVAEATGHPEKANWTRFPDKERAQEDAAELRRTVPKSIRIPWIPQK